MTDLLLLLIPLAFVMFVVYKGLNPAFSMMLAAILVCLVSGMDVMETMIGSSAPGAEPALFLTGIQSAVSMFFLKFLAANLFGQIIVQTGAARSISEFLTSAVVDRGRGFARKLLAVYVFMLVAIIFGFGGLDAFVCVFTLLPIGMEIFRQNDIPRRLLPATLFAGVTTAVCCPGTPLMNGNVLASMFFGGTATTAALVPGLVGVAVVLVCDCVYLWSALKKAEKRGEHFTPGGVLRSEDTGAEVRLPSPPAAVLPLLVVAVMNMILGVDVVLALLAGSVVAAVVMCGFIATPAEKLRPYMAVVDEGITRGGAIFIPMAIQQALATVIQGTSGFAYVSEALSNLALNTSPYLSYAISATFTGFLAGNAITGIQLSSGIFMPLLDQISISPAAMHRIGCFAISILDTIPINAAVISSLVTCGLTHKEGYGPIFRTTVLYIFFGMLAVILMCVLFPGLAAV